MKLYIGNSNEGISLTEHPKVIITLTKSKQKFYIMNGDFKAVSEYGNIIHMPVNCFQGDNGVPMSSGDLKAIFNSKYVRIIIPKNEDEIIKEFPD